jgi:hypothetical protein
MHSKGTLVRRLTVTGGLRGFYLGGENSSRTLAHSARGQVLRVSTAYPALQAASQLTASFSMHDPLEWCVLR